MGMERSLSFDHALPTDSLQAVIRKTAANDLHFSQRSLVPVEVPTRQVWVSQSELREVEERCCGDGSDKNGAVVTTLTYYSRRSNIWLEAYSPTKSRTQIFSG
jgi:hypothetical protein